MLLFIEIFNHFVKMKHPFKNEFKNFFMGVSQD